MKKRKQFAIFSILVCMVSMMFPMNVKQASACTTTDITKGSQLIDTTYLNNEEVLSSLKESQNNQYPIVLVHGLFGWGNNELYGLNYWGGKQSLRAMLTQEGYTVYTPTIGPVASNWDRACELYAYLVGGTVDYGKAHSQKCGHARYGRTYEGVYQGIGSISESGKMNKVHLVGHSMGGETVRVLAQLLEQGDESEKNETGTDTSPLFVGGHSWIQSITTIATPHDGSQYDEIKYSLEPLVHDLLAYVASITGANESDSRLDFQLDQWGLVQQEGESNESYIRRVLDSSIWRDTTDLSIWDLSLEGAKELNSWVKTQDDINYFSIACSDTHSSLLTGYQVPNINMNPLMHHSSTVMGSYTQNIDGRVIVASDWWENDGIVSVRSAIAPHEGSTDTYKNCDGNFEKGTWNYLGLIQDVDHIQVVGQTDVLFRNTLQNTFRHLALLLSSLQ